MSTGKCSGDPAGLQTVATLNPQGPIRTDVQVTVPAPGGWFWASGPGTSVPGMSCVGLHSLFPRTEDSTLRPSG